MTSEISELEKLSPKEKANLLKGDLSYKEHYDYIMNWYLRDRKITVPQADVHESLKDFLEALKELNEKVEVSAQSAVWNRKRSLFTGLVERIA